MAKVQNEHSINVRLDLLAGSCPKCKTYVSQLDDDCRFNRFCPSCGKKLKWFNKKKDNKS